jgi:aminocarboxymuconate-semialdehyde decarboxylase
MAIDGMDFRDIECNCYVSAERLLDCKKFSVNVQVISTVPVLFNYWAKPKDCLDLAKYLNDNISQTVAASPSRFIGVFFISDEYSSELFQCKIQN